VLEADRPGVVFSVWPVGSANDYAFTLGLTDWWKRRAERLPTETILADVGRVTGAGRARYFVNGLGVGFNGMVTVESRKIRFVRGLPLYTLAFLAAMAKHFARPRMTVRLDDEVRDGPTLALTVSLGQREGGFPVFPRASLTDGLFDTMHATALRRWHLLRYLPALATGTLPADHPLLKLGRAGRVSVAADAPLCVHTDGEFFAVPQDGVRELVAEVQPGRLRVEVFRPALYGGRAERSSGTV
jgi:diacylglycerol kinase family enzyme